MPVTEHLRELRKRLVRSGAAIVAGMVVGWIYYTQLFAWLSKPFNAAVQNASWESGQNRPVRQPAQAARRMLVKARASVSPG